MKVSHLGLPALMIKGTVRAAAFQTCPEQEGQPHCLPLSVLKKHLPVITVHPLIRMPVHIQQRLKPVSVAASGLPEIKPSCHPTAFHCRWQRQLFIQPEISVPAHEKIIKTELLPLPAVLLRRRAVIVRILRQISRHSCKRRDTSHPEIPPMFQFLHSLLKLFNRKKHGAPLLT